ncbi:uncharacterized protein LOC132394223 [Hypanus sabinus]|uniref:uncharacterized protein LOC132394223 n=1 Tax=Hypanus sabinus TaxID=79690 RepID=UPI0028C4AA56|nr:uncharacterized protein LOC132394223 [Hypanus sabinus]
MAEEKGTGVDILCKKFPSILDAMPPQVKSKLEEVVGLSSLTPRAFSHHVVHTVEKYRRDKRKLAEQQEVVQRKLLQMQLEELKKDKEKSKKMLPAITSEKQKVPETVQKEGPIQPGDQVYVRAFQRKWNEPRREGPFTVIKASPTAVQVEGHSTWYHLNHCTKAVPQVQSEAEPEVSGEEEQTAETSQEEQEADTAAQEFDQVVREVFGNSDDSGDEVWDSSIPPDNGDGLGAISFAPQKNTPAYYSADLETINMEDMAWE